MTESLGCNQDIVRNHISRIAKLEQRVSDLDLAFNRFLKNYERQGHEIREVIQETREQLLECASNAKKAGDIANSIDEDFDELKKAGVFRIVGKGVFAGGAAGGVIVGIVELILRLSGG